MSTKPATVHPQSRRWQDVRARALDANFDSDRRRVGERVAVLFRWLFLIVLGALNNLNPRTGIEAKVTIDLILVAWAAMNVAVQVLLARGFRPGKQFSLLTMALDIFFSAGLVYLSDGFDSPFFLALFLAVITNAVRFGITASFISALVISFLYLFIGGSFTPANFAVDPNATIGKIFLFLVVALATGYMTRELERERRAAVERAAQADSLRELSMNMVTETDIKDVFGVVADHAVHMTSAQKGLVVLEAPEGSSIVAEARREATKEPEAADEPAVDEGHASQVAKTGEAMFASNHRVLIVPIASGEGATAVLQLSQTTGVFTNQDLFAVNALSGSSAIPLANALRLHRSRLEATTDALTGLANAREFRRRLESAFAASRRRTRPLSLLLIDFDLFKSVNDQLGHQHGDVVLQLGANAVRGTTRGHDLVARVGGDELAVLADDTSSEGAQRLAARIIESVHAAAVQTTPGKHLTFSIGVATYPEDALSPSELNAAADEALYLAKRLGKDRCAPFAQLVAALHGVGGKLGAVLGEGGAQVVVAAAHVTDLRSPLTRGHSSRVAAIAETMGRHAGVTAAEEEMLRTAAYLHDVGHTNLGPEGTAFEAPGHAEAGGAMTADAGFDAEVADTILHHHDRWDGTGSVDGLAGVQIPVMARVLAVVESFEAMTAGRDGPRLSPREAQDRLAEGSGLQFDPGVVAALKRAVRDGSFELELPDAALPRSSGPGASA